MPKKRRTNGRNKKNRGNTANVVCSNCGRLVAKDKVIKRFQVRDIIDAGSKEDISNVQHYDEYVFPKTF